MQSGVPSLPVVCSDKHSCSSSKYSDSINGTPRKNKSPYTNATHLIKRKSFNDMHANSPYRNSARFYPLSQPGRSNKNPVGQRILSAKMLRVKQLQNQLTDAHYHLNELSNENKLLKAIQKKQESALKRYEGTNAELPRIINSHHEESRILQMKYKKLKEQNKSTCDTLKEKEKELHSLQVFNKRLLQLSQDRNLLEREKLQSQVSDLNHQIQQQQDMIQTLNKKLALEAKSLKQQNHAEVMKHKETQKNLQETLEKLKALEDLLDNREKRLYYNNQLSTFNKNRSIGNYSFSSLEDSGVSLNYSKSNIKKIDSDINDKILPTLSDLDMNFERKVNGKNVHDGHYTFTSKFRLPKSGSRSISAKSLDRLDKSPNSMILKKHKDEEALTKSSQELDKIDLSNEEEDEGFSKKTPMDELDYAHIQELTDKISDIDEEEDLKHENLFRKSREVCARLTSDESPTESVRTIVYPRSNHEEIQNMIKNEFKIGHDLGSSMLQKTYGLQIEENKINDSDIKNRDILIPIIVKTEHLNLEEDIQKEEDETEVNLDNLSEKDEEHKDLETENSPNGNGNRTFRQIKVSDDVGNSIENINNLTNLDVKDSTLESEESLESEGMKEKLDIYLDNEDKSKTRSNSLEKIVEFKSEIRRNSLDINEKKNENEKVSKKSFDKAKLLAEMKAIDNNDNIEYYDQKVRRNSGSNVRSQITENLYRGIPTQRRGDAITNMFMNTKIETKTRGNGFTKFH